MTTAADRDWNRVLPRELHTTSHVVNVRDAHHRERMTIVGKVPHLPRLVITRRIPTQHPPTNHAGKIIQVGNRIVDREGGQSPHRTRGRKPAMTNSRRVQARRSALPMLMIFVRNAISTSLVVPSR